MSHSLLPSPASQTLTREELDRKIRSFRLVADQKDISRFREAKVAPRDDRELTAEQLCDHLFDLNPTDWSSVVEKIVVAAFNAARKNLEWSRTAAFVATQLYYNIREMMSDSEASAFGTALCVYIHNVFMDLWHGAASPQHQTQFPQYSQPSDREAITTFAADVYAAGLIDPNVYGQWIWAVSRCEWDLEPVKYTFIMLSRGISNDGRKLEDAMMGNIQFCINYHLSRRHTADTVFDEPREEKDFRSLMAALMDDAYKNPSETYSKIEFKNTVDDNFPSCYTIMGLEELGILERCSVSLSPAESSFSDEE